jgi:hypothetical protein
MGRPAKHPIQEFNGHRYYRKPNGYYKADFKDGGSYLHRDVWEHHHGPIPGGHHIHHRDHNKAHCELGNLELLASGDHARLHFREHIEAGTIDCSPERMAAIRPLASEWHRSEEGRIWHREHAKRMAASRAVENHACAYCGQGYAVKRGARKRGFCSMSCQGMARKASGVDDEDRICAICGSGFRANRYIRRRTCSHDCKKALLSRSRLQHHGR